MSNELNLNNIEPSDDRMERLLVAMDESLKLGFSADELTGTVYPGLSPEDRSRFEEAKNCVRLLNLLLRPYNRSSLDVESRDNALKGSIPLFTQAETFSGTSRYEVIRKIGKGAMGVVYEAQDRDRNIRVALKVLSHVNASQILRFKKEFRRLANVAHANVVSLFELIQEKTDWLIAMELVNGADFSHAVSCRRLSSNHALPALFEINSLFQQLADGLNELHSFGILHRDLKPHNVMVTTENRVVVIDFGLATSFDWRQLQDIPSQEFAGTCAYMAPEQAACRSVTPASDWYSFGVMLYESIAGKLPFAGPLLMVEKQFKDPPRLVDCVPEIPVDWSHLCCDLMSTLPQNRPLGGEVLERLRELVNSRGGALCSPKPGKRLSLSRVEEPTTFVGRVSEHEQLRNAFEHTLESCPVVVAVRGPSGIGKSTLLEHFLSNLTPEWKCVILRGCCNEQESLPFKTLDSLVDSLCKHLGKLSTEEIGEILPADFFLLCQVFPVLASVVTNKSFAHVRTEEDYRADPVLLRRKAFDALRDMLAKMAQRVPLVLFIDDLQWGDTAGAVVLSDMLKLDRPAKLMLIIAFREHSNSENNCLNALGLDRIDALSNRDSSSLASQMYQVKKLEINLASLPLAEASFLATSLLAAQSTDIDREYVQRGRQIATESRGIPYFIHELVRYANSDCITPEHAESIQHSISLDELLRQRVQSLPNESRLLVTTVAVAGHPVPLNLACKATALNSLDSRLVKQLRSTRLLRFDGAAWTDSVSMFHDRMRESIVDSLAADELCEVHLKLASVLETSAFHNQEAIAFHFDAAKQFDRARQYYRLSGDSAQKAFAFEKAVGLYRRALELTPPSDENVSSLTQLYGEACEKAGRSGEAAAAFLAAATVANKERSLELQLAAARQYCIGGFTDEGRVLLRKVLSAKRIHLSKRPTSVLATLMYQRLCLWRENLSFVIRSEDELPPSVLQRIDLMWDAVSGLSFQEPVAVASLHTMCLREALKAGEPRRLVRALALEAILTATSGPKTKARVDSLLAIARNIDSRGELGETDGMLGMAQGATAFLQVRMPDAVAPLRSAETIFASKTPKAWWELTTTRSLLTWAYMHIGDLSSLRKCVEAYERDAEERGDRFLLSSISSAGRPQLLLSDHRPDFAERKVNEIAERIPYEQFQQQHVSMLYSHTQIDLYRNDGKSAWARLDRNWKRFWRSMQYRNQFARVTLLDLRARSALLSYRKSDDPRMLQNAIRDAKRIAREHGNWVVPFVDRLEAAICEARGVSALGKLTSAAFGFERLGFRTCAAVLNRRRGQLMDNAEGCEVIRLAEQLLGLEGIQSIDDFQRLYY